MNKKEKFMISFCVCLVTALISSSNAYSALSNGCAVFTTKGDIFFRMPAVNSQLCLVKCLKSNGNYKYFVTSYFIQYT